jgi:hypothetical protein
MEQFMPDSKFSSEHDMPLSHYDLHGVVNHYGSLGFGHYVSFTKNAFDNNWYKYDDNIREQVKEEEIEKESAYLLFYVRKDIPDKDVSQILPNIEESVFLGKPVKTVGGKDGFIVEVFDHDSFNVKFKEEKTPKRLE